MRRNVTNGADHRESRACSCARPLRCASRSDALRNRVPPRRTWVGYRLLLRSGRPRAVRHLRSEPTLGSVVLDCLSTSRPQTVPICRWRPTRGCLRDIGAFGLLNCVIPSDPDYVPHKGTCTALTYPLFPQPIHLGTLGTVLGEPLEALRARKRCVKRGTRLYNRPDFRRRAPWLKVSKRRR
jgi:hypothetical protein